MINKDLMYSTENATQYSANGLYGEKTLKRVDRCITESLHCVSETNTMW